MNEARPLDRDAAAALIEPLTDIVIRAGAAILAVNRSAMKVDGKTDGSPVTEADLAADQIIAEGLAQVAPDIPSLSEERALEATLPYKESFFLIDPLDGTKEFVAGRNEFTVNLALVTHGNAAARHRQRARARADLARHRRPRRGTADAWRGQAADRAGSQPPLPAARPAVDGRGQPLAWRCQDRSLHCGKAGRGTVRTRLGGQIRPGRRRLRRYLSPAVADLANGTWPRAMRSLRPPAAGSRIQTVRRWFLAPGGRTSSSRNSSPGAIRNAAP